MMIIMPEWYGKASEKLDKVIDDIIRENCIDWQFSHDSAALNSAKNTILQVLVRIDEQVKNPMNLTREEVEEMKHWGEKNAKKT